MKMRVFSLFPSLSLNNDPQLEFFSVTMHCCNAGLLALWLILCTQGHEDFNLSSWNCLCVYLLLCLCACAVYIYLCVFSSISTLLSPNHQF